jgi:D-sedoheptulose 7-phosphate isomerase
MTMSTKEFVSDYLEKTKEIAFKIDKIEIERMISILFDAWKEGKQVFLAGNGGSASTATHFASDLSKYTLVEGKKRFRAICLNDNIPLVSALTNDLGWENVYIEQLKSLANVGDVFVAISVHGGSGKDKAGLWSQNLLKATKHIRDNGGQVIGLAGFDGGLLKQVADACVVVPMDSTPQVEGFHAVLTHLVCARLKELIENE